MSVHNAILLLKAIDDNPALKEEIYFCEETDQVLPYLQLQGYHFDKDELEDAIRDLQVQCRTEEDVRCFRYKANWIRFLTEINENTPEYFLADYLE
jgi:cell fate (sporulation/competence/biofilm development) regulator YlbF (YheA/YmcA/DUF963 family)